MLLVAMNRVCLRGNGRTAQTEWYGGGGGWAIKWRVRFGYKCQSSFTTAIYFLQETFAWSPTPPPPPPPLPRLTDVGVFLQRSCREDRPLSPSKLSLLAIRPFPSLCPVLHAFHYLHFSPCFPSAFIPSVFSLSLFPAFLLKKMAYALFVNSYSFLPWCFVAQPISNHGALVFFEKKDRHLLLLPFCLFGASMALLFFYICIHYT